MHVVPDLRDGGANQPVSTFNPKTMSFVQGRKRQYADFNIQRGSTKMLAGSSTPQGSDSSKFQMPAGANVPKQPPSSQLGTPEL